MRRLISLLPVLLVSVTACGGSDQPAVTPSSTTASSPSTTSAAVPATLDGLAERPCEALAEEDTVALDVFIEASEVPDQSGKSCQWGARGALVQFTAFPTADETQAPDAKHLTLDEIEGHQAMIGTLSRSGNTGYTILVSTGPDQSFRIVAVNFGENTPGPDVLTVGKNFAAAILRRLG